MLATVIGLIVVGLHTLSFVIFAATISGFSGVYASLGWVLAGLLNVLIYLLLFIFLFLPGYILLLPAYHLTRPAGSKIVSLLLGYDWFLHLLAAYQVALYRPLDLTSLGGIALLLGLSALPMVLAAKTFRGQRSISPGPT